MTAAVPNRVAIGLGANLGAREQTIGSAILELSKSLGPCLARSKYYETEPLVLAGEDASLVPRYLNAAALFSTSRSPLQLLELVLEVEKGLGRDRSQEARRWQSRIIDIDILAVESLVLQQDGLIVPHPEMHKRSFVLLPFCDIWPEWQHPRLAKTPSELLSICIQSE